MTIVHLIPSFSIIVVGKKILPRISVTNGKKMLNIFNTANTRPNIFEQFAYMDKREDIKRTQRNQDQLDTAEFNEKAAQYRQTDGNPNAFKKRPLNFNNQGIFILSIHIHFYILSYFHIILSLYYHNIILLYHFY